MLALALALAAHADPVQTDTAAGAAADQCMTNPSLFATIPAAEATDVPVDVHPSFVFTEQCGGSPTWLLEIVDLDGNVLGGLDFDATAGVRDLATVTPTADLPADTDLILRATPTGGYYGSYGIVETPFHTGSGAVQPLIGAPTVAVNAATWFEGSGIVTFDADITPAQAPDGLTQVWIDTSFDTVELLFGAGPFTHVPADVGPISEPEDEVCLTVSQIDGHGTVVTGEDCIVPEIERNGLFGNDDTGGRGCFGRTKETPVAAFAFIGALGLVSRRRRA
jgi:hypothetical protein